MEVKIEDDMLYDVPGIAKVLDIAEKTVRLMLGDGRIKGTKLGRKWYITGASIKAHFESGNSKVIEPIVEKKPKKAKK